MLLHLLNKSYYFEQFVLLKNVSCQLENMLSYCLDLFKAVENGYVALVEKLLAAGIDIEARHKYYGKYMQKLITNLQF